MVYMFHIVKIWKQIMYTSWPKGLLLFGNTSCVHLLAKCFTSLGVHNVYTHYVQLLAEWFISLLRG